MGKFRGRSMDLVAMIVHVAASVIDHLT